MRPTGVTRLSPRAVRDGPPRFTRIERNLKRRKFRNFRPTRSCEKKIGHPDPIQTAAAMITPRGKSRQSATPLTTMSKRRLSTVRKDSNAGRYRDGPVRNHFVLRLLPFEDSQERARENLISMMREHILATSASHFRSRRFAGRDEAADRAGNFGATTGRTRDTASCGVHQTFGPWCRVNNGTPAI